MLSLSYMTWIVLTSSLSASCAGNSAMHNTNWTATQPTLLSWHCQWHWQPLSDIDVIDIHIVVAIAMKYSFYQSRKHTIFYLFNQPLLLAFHIGRPIKTTSMTIYHVERYDGEHKLEPALQCDVTLRFCRGTLSEILAFIFTAKTPIM